MAIPSFEDMLREAAKTLDEIQAHKVSRPVASEATENTNQKLIEASVTHTDVSDNLVAFGGGIL
ncbi:hypothetical protein [Alicyclobacillus sp. ALC3]|uniref:hypothetical protein n=1 Tax=Alicyclobacillus sp. ALC3 TaxID=2796143 RepID=UPI0023797AE8|nr:hypothetical protein [Alicyclobacillus sp. ALC3]WDL97836.1 hypothetical protein JC200_03640 [Alicyclobacillus sp. ALC3]